MSADCVLVPLVGRHGDIQGHAKVDVADAALTAHRWRLNNSGYAVRGAGILMHREVLGLVKGDGLESDHVNRDRLDNRRANLRIVSRQENQLNVGARRGSSSVFRGVYYRGDRGSWRAAVRMRGGYFSLGYHQCEEDAAAAVEAFRAEHMPDVPPDPAWVALRRAA